MAGSRVLREKDEMSRNSTYSIMAQCTVHAGVVPKAAAGEGRRGGELSC